jgi:hypothetical protein
LECVGCEGGLSGHPGGTSGESGSECIIGVA